MGRYYRGDIEGKFWFGVQNSNDASFFGGTESEPSFISYYFDQYNLEEIENGIKTCKKELGEFKDKLDTFFKENNSYNHVKLSQYLGIEEKKLNKVLMWYARLDLGEKIYKCVKENGECSFDAEL